MNSDNWADGKIQNSQIRSIKTGGCAEDCGYCSQSAHFDTGLKAAKLILLEYVVSAARNAKAGGADRLSMGAAWRLLKHRDLPKVAAMISAVKAEGLQTYVTLGMLEAHWAEALKEVGFDNYSHNLDTSPDYQITVVSTRTYQDRLDTLTHCREARTMLCVGGVFGMGESREDRVGLVHELSRLTPHPKAFQSICWCRSGARDSARARRLASSNWREIVVCRVVFPKSWVRLSAGRENMSDEGQALCLRAGANSIFVGDRLPTTDNSGETRDEALLKVMGFEHASREQSGSPSKRYFLIRLPSTG